MHSIIVKQNGQSMPMTAAVDEDAELPSVIDAHDVSDKQARTDQDAAWMRMGRVSARTARDLQRQRHARSR